MGHQERQLQTGDWVSFRRNGSSGHVARVVSIRKDVLRTRSVRGRNVLVEWADVEGWWPARTRDRSTAAMRSVGA